jgi:hypothetical protein
MMRIEEEGKEGRKDLIARYYLLVSPATVLAGAAVSVLVVIRATADVCVAEEQYAS